MRATAWLEAMTGRPAAWWMAAVQRAVGECSSPSDDPDHDQTDSEAFLARVSKLVRESMPPVGESYDENMRALATLAMVAGLWYSRLHYAKIHDPARPVSLRQKAYGRWSDWSQAMVSAMFDEREDATFFPGQKWDFPFGFDALSGDFV